MWTVICLGVAAVIALARTQEALEPPPFSSLTLPEGFQIGLYTKNSLYKPRQMTISAGPEGAPEGSIVYVGSSSGYVRLLCAQIQAYCQKNTLQLGASLRLPGASQNASQGP